MNDPKDVAEKIQALRIELIHAIQRRQGKSTPSDLGQEQGVMKIRRELLRDSEKKRLTDFLRIFPMNFKLGKEEGGNTQIELASKDVSDKGPIEAWLKKLPSLEANAPAVPDSNESQSGQSGILGFPSHYRGSGGRIAP